jgi:hypothetical protein
METMEYGFVANISSFPLIPILLPLRHNGILEKTTGFLLIKI